MADLQHGTGSWSNMQEVVRAAVQALADGLAAQQSQAAQLHHMVGALRRQAAGKADRPDAERALALSGAAQTEAAALRAELAGLRGEVLEGLADLRGRLDARVTQDELSTAARALATSKEVAELRSQVQSIAARGGLQESQRWQANGTRLKALEEAAAALQRRVDACEAQGLLLDAPDVRRRIDSLEAQLAGKADAAALETALAAKANRTSVAAALHRKANKEEVRPALEAALRRRADADGATARVSEAVAEVATRMEELEANALNELIARVEDLEGTAQQNKSIVEDIVGQLNNGGARPLTPYAGSAQHHSSSSAQALHSSTAAAAAAAAAAAELEEDVAAARQAAAAAHAAAQAVEAQLVDLGDEVVARLDALERAAAASRDQLQDQLQHASQGRHRPPSDAGAPSAHPAWGSPLSPTKARAGSRGDDGDGPELRSADALSTAGTTATVARAVAEELERGGWDEQMGWVEGQIEGHEARIAAVEGSLGSLQQQHAYLLAAVQSATTAAAAAAATANAAAPPPSPFLQRHHNAPTSTLAQSAQTAAPAPPPQGSGAFVTDGQSGWGFARVFSPTTSAGADSPFAAAVDAASSPSDSGHGGGGGGDVSDASPPLRHGGAERGAPADAPPATPPPPPRRRAARPLPAQGETTGGRGVSMQVYRGSPAPQESAASSSSDRYDLPQDLAVAGAGPRGVWGQQQDVRQSGGTGTASPAFLSPPRSSAQQAAATAVAAAAASRPWSARRRAAGAAPTAAAAAAAAVAAAAHEPHRRQPQQWAAQLPAQEAFAPGPSMPALLLHRSQQRSASGAAPPLDASTVAGGSGVSGSAGGSADERLAQLRRAREALRAQLAEAPS